MNEKIEEFEKDNEILLEEYKISKGFNELSKEQKLRVCEIIILMGTRLKEHVLREKNNASQN